MKTRTNIHDTTVLYSAFEHACMEFALINVFYYYYYYYYDRYGDVPTVINAHYIQLLNLHPASDQTESLRTLRDKQEVH